MSTPIEIYPNLYLLPALKPAAHIYLIKSEKNTLIDTGIKQNKHYLENQLNYLNLSLSEINDIIYTHSHYDHTSGGELFPDAQVYAHPLCKVKLQYQDETCIHALRHKASLPSRIPDYTLESGDIYKNGNYTFLIIHTPGHSDDGICLLEKEQKILISGDTVFAKGIPAFIIESGSDASLLFSIELLQQYNINTILPSHGRIEYDGNVCLKQTNKNIIKRIQQTNQIIIEESKRCGLKKH